jgi:probable phosphoglycerate mutase
MVDATRVGEALQGIHLDAFYTSPLQRACQTGQRIHAALKQQTSVPAPQIHQNLIEIGLPLWEGLLFEDVKSKYPDQYRDWHHAPHQLQMEIPGPDGPTLFYPVLALFEQATQVWQQLLPQHAGQTILLVGHSGINRALLCTALGLRPEQYHLLQQANCNITVLNFPDDTLASAQLEALNITSHLGQPLPKSRPGFDGLRLLLVRHGETDWNRQGRFQGQRDIPLNENGRTQGQQAATFLASTPLAFALSSPMARPKETAELILQAHGDLTLALDPRLCEISHGDWEGRLESEIEADYPGELDRWRTQPETVQMPAGENLQQVWERAIAAWNDLVTQSLPAADTPTSPSDRPIGLIVAHDAINKVILCHVAAVGPEKFWSFKQGNGAVSVIDFSRDGRPTLQAMNITTHLAGGILDQTAAGAL